MPTTETRRLNPYASGRAKTQRGELIASPLCVRLIRFLFQGVLLHSGGCSMTDGPCHHGAGVAHGCDGFVIAARDRVGANTCHLLEHLHTILQVADPRPLVVSPCNRNLANLVLQLLSYEE